MNEAAAKLQVAEKRAQADLEELLSMLDERDRETIDAVASWFKRNYVATGYMRLVKILFQHTMPEK